MIAIVSAPSNLGLRPPQTSSVPGCAKAPEALREAGLYDRLRDLGAIDAGVVLSRRYVDDHDPRCDRLRNQDAIIEHARRLAARLTALLNAGNSPLVLGGDCSLVVAAGLALARRGQCGLVHLDGHTDYRHPGNDANCASLAGEDLAAAVGRHWNAIANIDAMGPYFEPRRAVHVGCRDDDDHLAEVRASIAAAFTSTDVRRSGVEAVIHHIRHALRSSNLDGYWLHLDVDILDPSVMPAVDSPAPGGLLPDELRAMLSALAPSAIGAQVTVFDPDLDPSGAYAALLADIVAEGFAELGKDAGKR